MNDSSNTGAWIVGGLIVLALIGFGIWWWGSDRDLTDAENANQPATTTTQGQSPQGGQGQIAREDRTNTDIASIVASIPEASNFAALFASTGASASLSQSGTYTVFVPTNGAFANLTAGTLTNMTATQKRRLVEYHMVSGRAIDTNAVDTGKITAVSKDELNFEIRDTDNAAMVNSAFVIKQYRAKNGIVYLVSSVLVPPERAAQ
jgi:uncharacterized surface protein with fasciclin (FAS1) repeats